MKAIVRLGAFAGAVISAISLAGNVVAAVLIVGMAVLIGIDVIGRKFLGSPIIYTFELVGYAAVASGFFSAANTLAARRHITIDILTERLSDAWKLRLQIVTGLLGLIFLGVLTWTGAEFVLTAYTSQRTMGSVLAPPAYLVQWFIPAGALLTGLQLLVELVRAIAGSRVDRAHAPTDAVTTGASPAILSVASE